LKGYAQCWEIESLSGCLKTRKMVIYPLYCLQAAAKHGFRSSLLIYLL
jgi:hypothetical protein